MFVSYNELARFAKGETDFKDNTRSRNLQAVDDSVVLDDVKRIRRLPPGVLRQDSDVPNRQSSAVSKLSASVEYLNYIKYGADWGYMDNSNMRLRGLYYECDPTNFQGTAAQKVVLFGTQAWLHNRFSSYRQK
ncbi:unnamed protein product [Heligmosomoides polygyrus]|uniref:TonB-dependent receptor n=1 Tax=Heligmosomoides polygyrus TaxID=6339 RepID=A0A183G1E9_HELPZ|nr:unnamed protein product [Heligmosomoides polygyrus]